LVGPFVEADGGIQRIVRLFIQVQDVFHVVDELGVYLGTHLKMCDVMRKQAKWTKAA
jgi:hypothetical protein